MPKLSGIVIPAQISFAGQSFADSAADIPTWRVLSSILSLEYLWNEIRVKGGAYGAGANVSALGIIGFYSFRDPDASNSFRAFDGAKDFTTAFCASAQSLDKFIIGTVAKQEPLVSDTSRGVGADELYFRGIDTAMRTENRRKLLAASFDGVREASKHLDGAFRRCVIGSEAAVRSFEDDGIVNGGL